MKTLFSLFIAATLATTFGCSTLTIETEEDDGTATTGQALSPENCEERCMEEFHACREANTGGPGGASGCAKEKNRCKSRC